MRERLQQGDTDEEVIDYVVSRYGEFVLLKPRFSLRTMLLWAAPALLLGIGAIVLVLMARGRLRARAPAPLSAEEEARIDELLDRR